MVCAALGRLCTYTADIYDRLDEFPGLAYRYREPYPKKKIPEPGNISTILEREDKQDAAEAEVEDALEWED